MISLIFPLVFGLDDAAVATIIGAGISAVGGLASSYATRRSNKKLANQEFQQNKEMWSLQNQYNSPSSQVSRLKAAGLSPALAYGGSGQVVGNSDSTPALDYGSAQATPVFDSSSAIAQGLSVGQLKKQFEVQDSQIAMNNASADKLHMDAIKTSTMLPWEKKLAQSQLLINSATETRLYQETDNMREEIREIRSRVNLNGKQAEGLDLANEVLRQSQEDQIAYYKIRNRKEEAQIREINKKMQVYDQEIKESISRVSLNGSQERLNNTMKYESESRYDVNVANLDVLAAQADEIKQLTAKYAAETDLTELEVKTYIERMIYEQVKGVAQTVIDGYSAYATAGLSNARSAAVTQNADSATSRAQTYRAESKVRTGYAPKGPHSK